MKINKITGIDTFVELYDIYFNLLNSTQRRIFRYYYFDDMTLLEISNELSISKTAVHLNIKVVEQKLENYENILGISKIKNELKQLIDTLDLNKIDNIKQKLENIYEKI